MTRRPLRSTLTDTLFPSTTPSRSLVIEEKGAVVESQIKDLLYNQPRRPTVAGKTGLDGEPLVPSAGQLRPSLLAAPLAAWLARTAGLRSEEHTSELQSLMRISYAVFCLKKKNYTQ